VSISDLDRLALRVLVPGFVGAGRGGVPDWVRRRLAEGLGAVCLFARNLPAGPASAGELTQALRAERPDLLVAVDEEGGDVTRLHAGAGSPYPAHAALGAVDDPELTASVASTLGAELTSVGVNWDFAPVLDVDSDPGNPVIGVRSFGADPQLAARHGAAFVAGLQRHGVAATGKHFPGHGDTAVDSHLGLPVVAGSAQELAAGALMPFRAAIAAGVRSVMSAHLLVPAYDPAGPATLSRRILTGLLREELGFAGVIVTDGLEMAAISATAGLEEGAARAIAAGADALCVGGGLADAATVDRIRAALVAAVRAGRLAEGRLAEAADRMGGLAAWTAQAAQAAPGTAGRMGAAADVGLGAARRALRADGAVALPGAPCVVELDAAANLAAGATPWGIGEHLAKRLPGTAVVRLATAPADARAVLGGARAPLVVVVRDAHRFEWQRRTVQQLLAARPGAVVVEMGRPIWRPRGAGGYLATYGAARASALAAAELLAGARDGEEAACS
jgi:beta-N-acetylhexosaminidase